MTKGIIRTIITHNKHVSEVREVGELRLNIPNELHKQLKQDALEKGVTLKKLVIDIFEKYNKKGKTDKSQSKKED